MLKYRSLLFAVICLGMLVSSAFAYQVVINPPFANVPPGGNVPFNAVLLNNMGQPVPGLTWTWNVTPTSLGTITNTGLFTAGPDTGFGFVHAFTTFQNMQFQRQAGVHVGPGGPPPPPPPPPQLHAMIMPGMAFVMPDSSFQFNAVLRAQMGPPIPGLTWTWTVTPPTLGTISSTGLFTAASDTGHGAVHAVTTYQNNQYQAQAGVAVQLIGPPPPPPPPLHAMIMPGGAFVMPDSSFQFNAVLRAQMGPPIPGLTWTWTVTPATLGTISTTGLFTAASDTGHGAIHAVTTYQNNQYQAQAFVAVQFVGPPPPPPQGGAIAGFVTNDSSGAPITMGWVKAVRIGPMFQRQVPINPQGHYVIGNLPPGGYRVQCAAPSYLMEWFENAPTMQLADTVVVISGQQTLVNFALVHPGSNLADGIEGETVYTPSTPTTFTVSSANPNPFNPTTTISFQIPEASQVNLTVYDLSGRTVATLASGWRNAGTYQATFDGSNLATGIYIYRLQAGSQTSIGKMALVK